MNKYERLQEMLYEGGGYINTSDVMKAGISRTYFARFIRDNSLEKVAQGIYMSSNLWHDELYTLQMTNPKVVFSGETALYLHGLTDREYLNISVNVPSGFNGSRLRERKIIVHEQKPMLYEMGITNIDTNYGHIVKAYDKERCVCDLIKNRDKIEVQTFQTALKSYMRSNDKSLSRLVSYAQTMNIRDEVMKYVEVMV